MLTQNGTARADWFATTHWSVVTAATEATSPAAQQALERLCRTYWTPLYLYIRRQGCSPEDAQDLAQGFFERVLEKNYLLQASQAKGKFRAFLLACLKHYLSDQRDRARAAKRGGGATTISLDAQSAEALYKLEPVDALSPDKLYDRRWALTVLDNARSRLREEFRAASKEHVYDELHRLEQGGSTAVTYAQAATRLGKSETAIKSAISRMRQRLAELVREEIAHTVTSVAEVDAEIQYLLSVISSDFGQDLPLISLEHGAYG